LGSELGQVGIFSRKSMYFEFGGNEFLFHASEKLSPAPQGESFMQLFGVMGV